MAKMPHWSELASLQRADVIALIDKARELLYTEPAVGASATSGFDSVRAYLGAAIALLKDVG
jgi:hypothetical protein